MWAAVSFLSRLPVPRRTSGQLADAVAWFPVVGALLGGLVALADVGLQGLGFSSLVSSAGDVVLLLVLTGGLHADGLMDTSDAVFAHAGRERRLEIMRDPHAGSFAVIAVVAVLLLKVAAVASLPPGLRVASLVAAPVLGRGAIVLVATLFPAARPTGLGATVRAGASWRRLVLAAVAPALACAWLSPLGPIVLLAALVWAWLAGRWLTSLLGGLTGDCYGAVCETTETLVWLLVAPAARALSA